MSAKKQPEPCIVCGKPVTGRGEGRVHEQCYTLDVALAAQEGDDG